MSDGPQEYRRASDTPMETRMTVVEVELRHFAKLFEAHVTKSDQLLEKLDSRADHQDILMARIFAGLVLAGFVAQVIAPLIQRALGFPT